MTELISLIGLVLVRVNQLTKQGDKLMASMTELQTKVDELVAASAAREARDVAQDSVTAAQIQNLNDQLNALQAVVAAGGLSATDQAAIDAIAANVTAVIASLNAADPTLPVVA
jgi:phosphoribosylformylglycinamidine (FGAM) synthase-like amidotransferase family enzyme